MLQDHYLKSKRYANAVATMNQVSTQGTSSVMDQCESLQARDSAMLELASSIQWCQMYSLLERQQEMPMVPILPLKLVLSQLS